MTNYTDDIQCMLRPAGGGVHVVSTGVAEQQELQRQIYEATDNTLIGEKWREALAAIPTAQIIVLGVPSDVGAGFTRGANRGPAEIRKTLFNDRSHPYHDKRVLDVGDVFVVPHVLEDALLSPSTRAEIHHELYGSSAAAKEFPVSPLDICSAVLERIHALNPLARPIVIGGDHSVAWPAFKTLFESFSETEQKQVGLLHFDAHTDLLPHRLGVPHCFATWAYHANELFGRDGRLVQVGIRASGKAREHWESTLQVRQYWANEVQGRRAADVASEIATHFRARGVTTLYVSNDIDGTSEEFAAATGTPEPGGLHPDFVSELTTRLCEEFRFVGGDLVEVAPPLAGSIDGEPEKTLSIASRYLADLMRAGLS